MSPAQPKTSASLLLGDRDQLVAFRRGDKDVLTQVFAATSPRLRGVLFRCGLKSPADVDDALQTVYERAFSPRAREAYSGLSPYPAYLGRIARNLVLDLKKSGRARFELLDEEVMTAYAATSEPADPEQQMQQAQARVWRDTFVAELNDAQRQIYELRVVQGLSERDAAAHCGETRHRVRKIWESICTKAHRFAREKRLDEA